MPENPNSFDARDTLTVGGAEHTIFRLDALQSKYDVARLPFSLKVLLENLLRTEGNGSVQADDIEKLARWDAKAEPSEEIAFTPARVVMQDFTGVPAVVDLAAMRPRSTRSCPPSWSSTTRCRSTPSAPAIPSA
jgi:aconitate hydratase